VDPSNTAPIGPPPRDDIAAVPAPALGDLTYDELEAWLVARGEKPFRAKQLFRWLNLHGADDWALMTDLPGKSRARLEQATRLRELEPLGTEGSPDGTRKLLFKTARGEPIEAVLISMPTGRTLCLSSQSGCRLGCTFCLTGHLNSSGRNLSAGEIVDQYRAAVRLIGEPLGIDHLVFMGMGEPLLNYTNLRRAIAILTHPRGRNFSTRRLTVSTAGVVPLIPRLGEETGVFLAVSLNAPDDALRGQLMPINRRWPLAELKRALQDFPLPPRRRITLEYVLLAGVNDQATHAHALARFVRGLSVKVNLIPFNPHAAADFDTPSEASIDRFGAILTERRVSVQIRRSRGTEVGAACGQLGGGLDYETMI
jgi:23S rRNA (adenine2503-C2)-methyltransferase